MPKCEIPSHPQKKRYRLYCRFLLCGFTVSNWDWWESHFTEQAKQYDAERTGILEGYGLKVVRLTNVEVLQSLEGVCGELLGLIERKSWGQITLAPPLVTGEEMGKNPVSLIFYRWCRRMYADERWWIWIFLPQMLADVRWWTLIKIQFVWLLLHKYVLTAPDTERLNQ